MNLKVDYGLHFVIYGFSNEYPNKPDIAQLTTVLNRGINTLNDILVLKTNGLFCLISPFKFNFSFTDPEIVYQYDRTYIRNEERKETQEFSTEFIKEMYKLGLVYWKKHISEKELHHQR